MNTTETKAKTTAKVAKTKAAASQTKSKNPAQEATAKTAVTKPTNSKTTAKDTATKTTASIQTKSKPALNTNNIAKKATAPITKTTTIAKSKMVKPKKNAAEGLRDLFVEGLKDILWAEKALTKALPKMIENASTIELKNAFEKHLTETEGQIVRLENVFMTIGEKATAVKCEAMEGLLKEADGIMEDTEPGFVRDAGIIAAAQKVEHYEIATYGTLHAFARLLGETEAAEYLAFTLEQEKNADLKLTDIALSTININAAEN